MAADDGLLDEFCDALWLEDGLSRNTLESYRRDLRLFAVWLASERGKTLLNAERVDLLGYLAYKFQRRAKPRSAARLLSSLKRLYQFLLREGRITADPTLQVEAPKLPRSLPKSLTGRQSNGCSLRRTSRRLWPARQGDAGGAVRERVRVSNWFPSCRQVSQDMGVCALSARERKSGWYRWVRRRSLDPPLCCAARPQILDGRRTMRCSLPRAAIR